MADTVAKKVTKPRAVKKNYWVFPEYDMDNGVLQIATSAEDALNSTKSEAEYLGWDDGEVIIVAEEVARYEIEREGIKFVKLGK